MILITSPHPSFTKDAQIISKDYDVGIHIMESILEHSVADVQRILGEDLGGEIEVLVSRGGTADILRNHVDIPIVSANVSEFDTLKAFSEASFFSNSIAYLGYKDDDATYDLPFISETLGISTRFYRYATTTEILAQLDQIKDDDVQVVVVGSQYAEEYAKTLGLNVVLVRSSKRAIHDAILRAEEILRATAHQRSVTHRLKTVMNLSQEGMMIVDNDGTISYANSATESILHIGSGRLTGTSIADTAFGEIFSESHLEQKPVVGRIQEANAQRIIVNSLPLVRKKSSRGVVINFSSMRNIQKMEQQIRQELVGQGLVARYTFEDIVGSSPALMEAIKAARQFGLSPHTVIINGETGTGKERFVHGIHNVSARKDKPFVAVNCGAFPESLLDSELFGYVDGAFTGARKGGKTGLIELAHGGTLFLDEVDKMSMDSQVKILRVLQEKQIRPIGGSRMVPVDIRIIAATNRDLYGLTQSGKFLVDLYFRLNVLNIEIPPLRERREDILPLISCFCQQYTPAVSPDIFTADIRESFMVYNWPGNVRELENLTNRYITLRSSQIDSSRIYRYFPEFSATSSPETTAASSGAVSLTPGRYREMERELIRKLLPRFGGNKSALANFLGISRNTVNRMLH